MANPMLSGQIVVDASNKWIDYKIAAGAATSVAIATATYTDVFALLVAIAVALGANFSIGFSASAALAGKFTVYYSGGGGNLTLMWATGTHTGINAGTLMGFNVAADDSGGIYYAADYQAPDVWLSTRPPARDTLHWAPQIVPGGKVWRSLSGSNSKQVIIDSRRAREIEFQELPPEIIWLDTAIGAHLNRDFETFLVEHRAEKIAYYPDQTSNTHVHCFLVEPGDMVEQFSRPHVGIETWNFKLILHRAE